MKTAVVSNLSLPSILMIGYSKPSLTKKLEQFYNLTQVGNGADAIQQLTTSHFDAVVMDLKIPDMDGLSLFHTIRSTHTEHNLPIILLSHRDVREKVAEALRKGANDFIPTPIDNALAIARINAQLRYKREVAEKNNQIAALQAQQETQARLIRIIRHDLRNPIANLRLALDLLANNITDNTLMESMIGSLDATDDILEDFANAYLIQQTDEITREPISLDLLMSEIAIQYSAVVLHKEINVTIPQSGLVICEDRMMVKQAISNLLSNAMKYSPPKTSVCIQLTQSDNTVRIAVIDQGPGIPVEERNLLFTEFGKASTRPTGNEVSTGLGLWIVRTIMEKIGGRYGVDFPSEGGSAFWIELNVCSSDVDENS